MINSLTFSENIHMRGGACVYYIGYSANWVVKAPSNSVKKRIYK